MAKAESEIYMDITKPNKKMRLEKMGKGITFIAVGITILLTVMILALVVSKGVSIFLFNKGSIVEFFTGLKWNPGTLSEMGKPIIGALPLITGSFIVTLLSALICTPIAFGAAVFMTEISPRFGKKVLQPVMELLVGIPSVVYGFIGLSVVVPLLRESFSGSGFGIAAGTIVLSVMILPTITSLSIDAIASVPRSLREASYSLGATRWQTIYRVILKTAKSGLLTAVIFGMARAFGEALAVQMVIGNSPVMPTSLMEPASTLTSILTMGMGYTVLGQAENNALWSLALVLLMMSFLFIILVRWIGRKERRA
ncbi:phosphate ABC transporter permease subunit PstC [Lederbergia galactosidilytica]|uniref:Phosphate transport system permease protein n=2 Tax=Lederbergia galactosidilytica TaxID=217031 RepID=A0A177ZJF3_9BACI|nr:phosphate ABC transporter permease subunit PstC [Lederbergia galactosidilytica]KRG15099.1 phosphate ABC transporter permease [Virgibacillus soli]MBP1913285.1 phosphate transport system permease protein [Lederbergia galactosidilytica]OAK67935.1 phosphate ABC transporter permease [Lederbergia galactosidilytica]